MFESHSWTDYGHETSSHSRDNELFHTFGARELEDRLPSTPSLSRHAPLFCLQVITSLLSVFATIVVVRISCPKLESAYQRTVFLLNIALVINSIFLGLHPLLVDGSNDSVLWAFGNPATCSMVGFFLTFGSLAVSMYHTALAFYFYSSIQTIHDAHNNNHHSDGKKETESASSETSSVEKLCPGSEILANVVCVIVSVAISGVAASLNSFGYDPSIGVCTFHGSPNGDGDGDRDGDGAWLVLRDVFRWTLVASGAITILVTLIIRFRVALYQKKERNAEHPGGSNSNSNNNSNSNSSSSSVTDPDAQFDWEQKQIVGQKLKAISAQCSYYTISYLSSYVWFITLMFFSTTEDAAGKNDKLLYAFQILTVVFYPLLGFSNCVIYVRPRMQMLRIMYHQDSFFVALRVSMSKAGDPEEIEEVRAKIYGSNYSRSRGFTPEAFEPSFGDDDDDEDDEYPSGDLMVPSVVHFDPSCAVSVKSLVTTGGETDEENNDEPSS